MKTASDIASACQKLLAKGWKVRKERGIGCIRFRPPNYREFCDCPMTALHRDRFGTLPPELEADEYKKAARELHVSRLLRGTVVRAADWPLYYSKSEKVETARLLFLRSFNLPLDIVSDSSLACMTKKGRKLLQAEKSRRKKERNLELQP